MSSKSPFIIGQCENVLWKIVQSKQKGQIKPLPLPVGHKKVAGYVPVESMIHLQGKTNKKQVKKNAIAKIEQRPKTTMSSTQQYIKCSTYFQNILTSSTSASLNNQYSFPNAPNTSSSAAASKWNEVGLTELFMCL